MILGYSKPLIINEFSPAVTARKFKKGSKTFVEVRGLGASRDKVVLLGGKRAERAKAVVVCERAAYAADDPIRGSYTVESHPDLGKHDLHAVGLRADVAAAKSEAHRLLHPNTGLSRRTRWGHRYDNKWARPAAFAAAVEIVDET
jgi:hypothetical protein